jgi:hypothetical protein
MNAKIRAHASPWNQGVELLILSPRGDGVALPIQFEPIENPAVRLESTLSIAREQAQTLMDDLWNAGLRPTEGTGSAGALAATQRHLEDMRTLVFRKPQTANRNE